MNGLSIIALHLTQKLLLHKLRPFLVLSPIESWRQTETLRCFDIYCMNTMYTQLPLFYSSCSKYYYHADYDVCLLKLCLRAVVSDYYDFLWF